MAITASLTGPPVVIVEAGGVPVTDLGEAGAVNLTVVDEAGEPVTLVASGGIPVSLTLPDGTFYADA